MCIIGHRATHFWIDMKFTYLLGVFTLFWTAVAAGQTIIGRVFVQKTLMPLNQSLVTIERTDRQRIDTVYTSTSGVFQYALSATPISESSLLPMSFAVLPNHPNPFNSATFIQFQIPGPGLVRLTIYNCIGQIIEERSAVLSAGSYRIQWHAHGPSGVYFYTVRFAQQTRSGKMALLDHGAGRGLDDFISTNTIKNVQKTKAFSLKIIAEKFGFVPDTLQTSVQGGEQFEFALQTVHDHAWMIDLHNDILEKMAQDPTYHLSDEHSFNHTDFPRLLKGGVDVQFFSVWVDPASFPEHPWQEAVRLIKILKTELAVNSAIAAQAFSYQDILDIIGDDKIAACIGVEGGHVIENDPSKIDSLYHFGMRYLTITWNNSTAWAISAKDSRSATVGLTDFGKQVIRKLDSLGVLIDVSHVGKKTITDILATSKNPIIATHSGAYGVCPHYRNLTDEQILAISQRGGVIGVVFYPPFLVSSGVANMHSVLRHIDYFVKLAGVNCVAIGSDFDGIERTPLQLADVTRFPDLTLALLEHGYTREEVEKMLGKNFQRVFAQVTGNH